MLAKGHDFPRLTLVGVLGADNALYSADFRATERLGALLFQVAGRAGRAQLPGEVIVQTDFPAHPLYRALAAHDYDALAAALLAERRVAGLPPFAHLALLAAEAPRARRRWTRSSTGRARRAPRCGAVAGDVEVFPPAPAGLARRAGMERGQVLVRAGTRAPLQRLPAGVARGDRGAAGPQRALVARRRSDGLPAERRGRSEGGGAGYNSQLRAVRAIGAGPGSAHPRATAHVHDRRRSQVPNSNPGSPPGWPRSRPTARAPIALERPKQAAHGDYAPNVALQLAKALRRNPREFAQALVAALPPSELGREDRDRRRRVHQRLPHARGAAVGGRAGARRGATRSAAPTRGAAETVMVEFVSANPTGPLHVGHGRQAALGDSLANAARVRRARR